MQSIFNSSEFLKVLQTRVDRISDAEKNELRKAVNDTYDTYEGFLNSDRSFNTAIENGWVIKKGGEYILNPTDNISLRIQSLRMLCGFEREYTAALIGVTRQTYTKLEASGYEGGLNQAYIETLKNKSREKLYLIGENPKYADLWSFLVAPKETGETLECINGHKYEENYKDCPYCDLLEIEMGYDPKVSKEKSASLVNTFNDLINEESFLFNQFLEFLKIKDKDYLRKIIDKRKVGSGVSKMTAICVGWVRRISFWMAEIAPRIALVCKPVDVVSGGKA